MNSFEWITRITNKPKLFNWDQAVYSSRPRSNYWKISIEVINNISVMTTISVTKWTKKNKKNISLEPCAMVNNFRRPTVERYFCFWLRQNAVNFIPFSVSVFGARRRTALVSLNHFFFYITTALHCNIEYLHIALKFRYTFFVQKLYVSILISTQSLTTSLSHNG